MEKLLYDYRKKYPLLVLNMAKELAHGMSVSNLAYHVAKELGCEESFCHVISVAGMLHDIGKLQLAEYVHEKGDTLTVEEIHYVRLHTIIGARYLKKEGFSPEIVEMVLYHHENCDGSGYPYNRTRDEIPFGARILRVCDVFAALTSDRSYRKAFDTDTAIDLMIEEARFFDLQVFLAFMRVVHGSDLEKIMVNGLTEEHLRILTDEK